MSALFHFFYLVLYYLFSFFDLVFYRHLFSPFFFVLIVPVFGLMWFHF
jgi:hypothetical protein